MSRPAQAQAAEDEQQPADPPQLPPLDEEEPVAALDPTPQLEAESATEEAEEETSSCRRRVAPRTATNLTEEEKELVIDFLQQNPMLHSKRLAGYKDTAAKDRLWAEQAMQWWQSYSTFFEKFTELRVIIDLGIGHVPHSTNFNPYETILGVHQCKERDTEKSLVVVVQRSCVGWLADGYMFAVESSNRMWHIPLLFKLLGKDSPFIRCHRNGKHFILVGVYDGLTHVSHHMADGCFAARVKSSCPK